MNNLNLKNMLHSHIQVHLTVDLTSRPDYLQQ